jgi:hypothetical protein
MECIARGCERQGWPNARRRAAGLLTISSTFIQLAK